MCFVEIDKDIVMAAQRADQHLDTEPIRMAEVGCYLAGFLCGNQGL